MFKIWNNLTILYFKVPVHPFEFATVPVDAVSSCSMVSSVCRANFMDEGKPLHIWTATGLVVIITWMVMSENQFVMVMKDVDVVDWWKLVSDYWILVLDKDVEHRMTNDLGYIIDECGRFSISSWLVDDALSPKIKSHLKSPKFQRFSI